MWMPGIHAVGHGRSSAALNRMLADAPPVVASPPRPFSVPPGPPPNQATAGPRPDGATPQTPSPLPAPVTAALRTPELPATPPETGIPGDHSPRVSHESVLATRAGVFPFWNSQHFCQLRPSFCVYGCMHARAHTCLYHPCRRTGPHILLHHLCCPELLATGLHGGLNPFFNSSRAKVSSQPATSCK